MLLRPLRLRCIRRSLWSQRVFWSSGHGIKKSKRTEDIDEDEFRELPDVAPGVAEEYAMRDEVERIQKVLHSVSDPYKEVFMWRVYAGLSFKQIAQIFGKTENWACVTYHRARKIIKERLEEKNSEN